MSLLGFQQALCDLIASPSLCLSLRKSASALDGYDLTDRERDRLQAVVAQPGMSTSCTLYRVNRIAPIFSWLPLSCTVLGDRLMEEAEIYWTEGKPPDLQFESETRRFTRFLQRRIDAGQIASPYIHEVMSFELAGHDLRSDAGPPRRVVRFAHDPVSLLDMLAEGRRPADGEIAAGEYLVELAAGDGRIAVRVALPDDDPVDPHDTPVTDEVR